MTITHPDGSPCIAREQLFFERVVRAERLLRSQRQRVHQLQANGFDIARPRALLQLMEAVTEQFRIAWTLAREHRRGSPAWLEGDPALTAPSSAPGLPSRVPRQSPPGLPAEELAAFPCPHCGLTLSLERGSDGTLVYDVGQWTRKCRYLALQTPVLCQALPSVADVVH
jgi:hypothetical protein